MLMPSIGVLFDAGEAWPRWGATFLAGAAVFLGADFLETAFFVALVAAFFWAVGFFLAVGFAGIGIVMPGMCMCCAVTGAETVASASALAASNNGVFTMIS
jgi:hypothetical protein